jgi:hypothetical protein
MKNQKPVQSTGLAWHCRSGLAVKMAHGASMLCARSARSPRRVHVLGGVVARSLAALRWPASCPPDEHGGASGVAPGNVGRRGSHRGSRSSTRKRRQQRRWWSMVAGGSGGRRRPPGGPAAQGGCGRSEVGGQTMARVIGDGSSPTERGGHSLTAL